MSVVVGTTEKLEILFCNTLIDARNLFPGRALLFLRYKPSCRKYHQTDFSLILVFRHNLKTKGSQNTR